MSEVESTITASSRMIMRPCLSEGPTPSGFYPPLQNETSDATGVVMYVTAGIVASGVAVPYYLGHWWFFTPSHPDSSAPAGFVDGPLGDSWNTVAVAVVGPGTMTIYTRGWAGGESARFIQVNLYGYSTENPAHNPLYPLSTQDPQVGPDITVVVPDDEFCFHVVYIFGASDPPNDGWVGFGGVDWDTGDVARKFTAIGGHVTYSAEMAGGG